MMWCDMTQIVACLAAACGCALVAETNSLLYGLEAMGGWVDEGQYGHCYMIYLYLIYIYVIIIYIIVYSFFVPSQTGARWSSRFTCRFTRPTATSSPVCQAGRLRKVWWLQMDLWFWHWTNFTLAVPQCIQDSMMWLVHTGLDYLDYFP